MKRNLTRGFTLIELLVVIAIIGILASVVLASLNTARQKGQDASIQQQINNIRAQAEIFYDDNGRTYTGLCLDAQVAAIEAGVNSAGGTFVCSDAAQEFAVSSILIADNTEFYCADSTGYAGITTDPAAATVCP